MKYQELLSLKKKKEKIFMYVVCCVVIGAYLRYFGRSDLCNLML